MLAWGAHEYVQLTVLLATAGSLTACPLDVAGNNDRNRWGERGKILLVAHQVPHSRAALNAPPTPQRNQLLVVAREIAHVHRAAPHSGSPDLTAFGAAPSAHPEAAGGSPAAGPGDCAAVAARPLAHIGRRLTGA